MPMPEYSEHHVWVGAAYVVFMDARQARRAVLRHNVRYPREKKIDVLEVYCEQCRRPWDDVADELCVAAQSNEHLRGGPIGERKKRAHHKHNCAALGCEPPADDGDEPLSATG